MKNCLITGLASWWASPVAQRCVPARIRTAAIPTLRTLPRWSERPARPESRSTGSTRRGSEPARSERRLPWSGRTLAQRPASGAERRWTGAPRRQRGSGRRVLNHWSAVASNRCPASLIRHPWLLVLRYRFCAGVAADCLRVAPVVEARHFDLGRARGARAAHGRASLPGGGSRLQYSGQPFNQSVWNADFDAQGRLVNA
jgi:hypothetical protein